MKTAAAAKKKKRGKKKNGHVSRPRFPVADNASNTPQTVTLNGTGVSFVSNVGTAETAQSVTVNITKAGTLIPFQVLTQGVANLDFTYATTAVTLSLRCSTLPSAGIGLLRLVQI